MPSLLAGYAECDITPPVGVEMLGYGIYLGRRSTGIKAPLKAKALVLDDGSGRVAIVACDLCGIQSSIAAQARAEVGRRGLLKPENLIVPCTHTHSGPATYWSIGWGELHPPYLAVLPDTIAGAVEMAVAAMKPVKIGCGKGSISGIAENRVEGDAGPVNEEIGVIRLDDMAGAPYVVLYNYACHGVTNFHTNTLLNPDWIGFASEQVTRELGCHAMFLQGSCGDINPRNVHTGKVAETGVPVGCEVARIASRASTDGPARATLRRGTVTLPFVPDEREMLAAMLAANREKVAATVGKPEVRSDWALAKFNCEYAELALAELASGHVRRGLTTEVSALRLGDTLMLCHGAELFTEYGDRLKAAGGESTFVVGYADDAIGYIPDPDDHARGGYAAQMVPRILGHWRFTEDAGDLLCEALLGMADTCM